MIIILQREWNWESPPPKPGKYETQTPVYTRRGVHWVQEILYWTGRAWNDERYPATDIKAWRDISAWRPAWSQTTRIFMEEEEPDERTGDTRAYYRRTFEVIRDT